MEAILQTMAFRLLIAWVPSVGLIIAPMNTSWQVVLLPVRLSWED
jgi:hypothetical protein